MPHTLCKNAAYYLHLGLYPFRQVMLKIGRTHSLAQKYNSWCCEEGARQRETIFCFDSRGLVGKVPQHRERAGRQMQTERMIGEAHF